MDNVFGERLYELRINANLTQQEFVNLFNSRYSDKIDKGIISRYENGKSLPKTFQRVKMIADLLGVDTDYLIDIEKPKTKINTVSNFDLLPDDVQELMQELKDRPELKVMFSTCKNATKEDVLEAIRILERFKK